MGCEGSPSVSRVCPPPLPRPGAAPRSPVRPCRLGVAALPAASQSLGEGDLCRLHRCLRHPRPPRSTAVHPHPVGQSRAWGLLPGVLKKGKPLSKGKTIKSGRGV